MFGPTSPLGVLAKLEFCRVMAFSGDQRALAVEAEQLPRTGLVKLIFACSERGGRAVERPGSVQLGGSYSKFEIEPSAYMAMKWSMV